MRVGFGADRTGPATTVRGVDPATVVDAIRDPDDDRVACPTPGPVHEHVGFPAGERRLERRAALAAVARSRGETAPQDEAIRAAREELAGLSVPAVDLAAARRRLTDSADERDRLAERVARLQGRVEARREADASAADEEAALTSAARRLAEVETRHAAADEAHAAARERARQARDVRERRLRLRDRLHNRRRAAREHLAEAVEPAVETAVGAAGWTDAGTLRGATDRTATLALARVGALEAPVVTTPGPFDDAAAARAWLGAPVVHVYHG